MGNLSSVRHIYSLSRTSSTNAHPELSIFTTGTVSESTLFSSLIAAIVTKRLLLFKFLLQRGAPIDIRDNEGNTLLHIAILNESSQIFKYLVKRNDLDKDATNFHQATALTLAALSDKISYAKLLIEKGADVNITDQMGCTPLHYACHFSSPQFCHLLIKAGSDVNVQNLAGKTPIYIACEYGNAETIHMLLYYGADVSVPCTDGKIPLMLNKFKTLDLELRLILYYSIFDDDICPMELKILTRAMIMNWPLFEDVLNKVSTVSYNEDDLQDLSDSLLDIKVDYLHLFFRKFDYVIKDMFFHCCTLTNIVTRLEKVKRAPPEFIDLLYLILQSNLVFELTQSCCRSVSPLSSLVNIFYKNKLSLATLMEIICCLMSYGVTVTSADLNAVYVLYGRCELFEIMLHMDIQYPQMIIPCCTLYDHEVIQQSIIPYFVYDVNLNIDKFLENPNSYLLMDLDVLLNYFALPKLKDFFLADDASRKVIEKIKSLPTVPSLVELSRHVAREHIIYKFNIKNSSQFYTILKWLPINSVYKKILSFEKRLY